MDPEATMSPPSPPADETYVVSVPSTQGEDLPSGWSTAVSPIDGRVYYWNSSTGATSWTHPNFPDSTTIPPPPPAKIETAPSLGDYSGIIAARSTMDFDKDIEVGSSTITTKADYYAMAEKGGFHDFDPNEPINSHRFYSIVALILFFPLGIFALCQSCNTVSKWKQGRYAEAHDRSQQTLLFSHISCAVGFCFWMYLFFFSGPGPWGLEWPVWWPHFDFAA